MRLVVRAKAASEASCNTLSIISAKPGDVAPECEGFLDPFISRNSYGVTDNENISGD